MPKDGGHVLSLYILIFLHQTATRERENSERMLYILIFLHQTATREFTRFRIQSCISLYSYIKPQRKLWTCSLYLRCISLYSYIKPQPVALAQLIGYAVYPYIPTSNRNESLNSLNLSLAVYPYIPTSNRNRIQRENSEIQLYILIFLHQTATEREFRIHDSGCISLYSYIKPQQRIQREFREFAVYPYIPTSNRNVPNVWDFSDRLYILIFLHQTATLSPWAPFVLTLYILIFLHQTATWLLCCLLLICCISLYSYIKPQPGVWFRRGRRGLYILIFLHQTATLISGNSFVQRGIHYIQEIKNGSVGPYFIAKLLKKFQLYRLSNKFSFLTTFCAFRLSTEIINITILLISNRQYTYHTLSWYKTFHAFCMNVKALIRSTMPHVDRKLHHGETVLLQILPKQSSIMSLLLCCHR